MTKSIQAQTCEGRGERGDSESSSSSRCFLGFTPNNATTIICTESSPIIRRRTRASGRTASERNSASIASNIAPVTAFSWPGLSSVNLWTSGSRWISTAVPGAGSEGEDGLGDAMGGKVEKEIGAVNRDWQLLSAGHGAIEGHC